MDPVLREIEEEARRARASGRLPTGYDRDLDAAFSSLVPGTDGRTRLRQALDVVDGASAIELQVPVTSNRPLGARLKRLVRGTIGWYVRFFVSQIAASAGAVARALHAVADEVDGLHALVEDLRRPTAGPSTPPPSPDPQWWWPAVLGAARGVPGPVLHGECGVGHFVGRLAAAGVVAYGVDPAPEAAAAAVAVGRDVRACGVLEHLESLDPGALGGLVLEGAPQWLATTDRVRLAALAGRCVAGGGMVAVASRTPEAWGRTGPPALVDLAPGRPLHPETWAYLLAPEEWGVVEVRHGGPDPRAELAADVPAAVAALVPGPEEYLVLAVRER